MPSCFYIFGAYQMCYYTGSGSVKIQTGLQGLQGTPDIKSIKTKNKAKLSRIIIQWKFKDIQSAEPRIRFFIQIRILTLEFF